MRLRSGCEHVLPSMIAVAVVCATLGFRSFQRHTNQPQLEYDDETERGCRHTTTNWFLAKCSNELIFLFSSFTLRRWQLGGLTSIRGLAVMHSTPLPNAPQNGEDHNFIPNVNNHNTSLRVGGFHRPTNINTEFVGPIWLLAFVLLNRKNKHFARSPTQTVMGCEFAASPEWMSFTTSCHYIERSCIANRYECRIALKIFENIQFDRLSHHAVSQRDSKWTKAVARVRQITAIDMIVLLL